MRRIIFVIVAVAYAQLAPACRADLLVAGFSADKVIRYDAMGGLVGVFAEHPTMDGPTALVYNSGGNLLVLNEFSHNVLAFDGTTGSFVGTFIDPVTLGSAGVGDPGDMEIGPDGNLYITSHFSTGGNVWRFNGTTGASMGVFASTGSVNHTHGLTFGPDGNLYQHNLDSKSIIKFDGATGASLGTFTSHPDLFPGADLTFGPTGTLYATLDGAGGTMAFDGTTGAFLGYIIPPGSSTWGLLVDGSKLYVGVTSTGVVKEFDAATGAFISDFITGAPAVFDIIAYAAIPEPSSVAFMLLFLCGLTLLGREETDS